MAVVANLPAPISAPQAILISPAEAGATGKVFFHPFFPLLHLMHLPHLYFNRPFGHHGLGGFHHGLGGFHHGLGGGFGGGLGGFGHLGHFPFRTLQPDLAGNGPGGGNVPPASAKPGPKSPSTPPPGSAPAVPNPAASAPPGRTKLTPVSTAPGGLRPPAFGRLPPFKAFITPTRKVIPAYPVSAYPLPAPVPAYTTHSGPLRLTSAESIAPEGGRIEVQEIYPGLDNFLFAPNGPPGFVPLYAHGSFPLPGPEPGSQPELAPVPAPGPDDEELQKLLPPCDCVEDDEAAMTRVELDHSMLGQRPEGAQEADQGAVTSATPAAPDSPGPLAPPPTEPPPPTQLTPKGPAADSSPELPQQRERLEEEDEEDGTQTAIVPPEDVYGSPSDTRVLIVVGELATTESPEATTAETTDATTTEEEETVTTELAMTTTAE